MIIRCGTLEVLEFDTFLYDLLGTLVCGFDLSEHARILLVFGVWEEQRAHLAKRKVGTGSKDAWDSTAMLAGMMYSLKPWNPKDRWGSNNDAWL